MVCNEEIAERTMDRAGSATLHETDDMLMTDSKVEYLGRGKDNIYLWIMVISVRLWRD